MLEIIYLLSFVLPVRLETALFFRLLVEEKKKTIVYTSQVHQVHLITSFFHTRRVARGYGNM